ncbi:MAG: hypothetical protein R6W70_02990 [bacterium]
MKRFLITFLMVFTLFTVACGEDGGDTGDTGNTGNFPFSVPVECGASFPA